MSLLPKYLTRNLGIDNNKGVNKKDADIKDSFLPVVAPKWIIGVLQYNWEEQ
jgi:hypothetical protein